MNPTHTPCAQGMKSALGAAHLSTLEFSLALALLLAQTDRLEHARALYRIEGRDGAQHQETLRDARALATLLRERGEGADAATLERAFSL